MNKKSEILYFLAFVSGIVGYGFWNELKEIGVNNVFYVCIALSFTLLHWAYSLKLTGKMRRVSEGFLSVVFAKLIDELFYDPLVFEWIELWTAIGGFILIYVTGATGGDKSKPKDIEISEREAREDRNWIE